MKADGNCLFQMFALSRVSVFKIPFSLSMVIPNASFLRDLTNDQNFFTFSFFLGQSGSVFSISKEKISEICFQYASLLNMCSEPFVVAHNVRVWRARKLSLSCFLMRRLIKVSIHGKLYFVLVIFVGINLSIAVMTSDLKLTHRSLTDE